MIVLIIDPDTDGFGPARGAGGVVNMCDPLGSTATSLHVCAAPASGIFDFIPHCRHVYIECRIMIIHANTTSPDSRSESHAGLSGALLRPTLT